MRRRHGCPVQITVPAAPVGAVDRISWCGQIDRNVAVVRKGRPGIGRRRRRHRDDIVVGVIGGIGVVCVVIPAVIAGRRDKQLPRLPRVTDRGADLRTVAGSAPAVVCDTRAVIDRVSDRRRGAEIAAAAAGIEKLGRHELGVPGDAGNPDGIVALRRDCAGDVRTVAVLVVIRIAGADTPAAVEIVAVIVVDIAVAVVVDPVAPDLAGIDPEIVDQVGMVDIDPGIDNADDDGAAAGFARPRIGRGDGVHAPGPIVVLIVRNGRCREVQLIRRGHPLNLGRTDRVLDNPVAFDVRSDAGIDDGCRCDIHVDGHRPKLQIPSRAVEHGGADIVHDRGDQLVGDAVDEFDDQIVGHRDRIARRRHLDVAGRGLRAGSAGLRYRQKGARAGRRCGSRAYRRDVREALFRFGEQPVAIMAVPAILSGGGDAIGTGAICRMIGGGPFGTGGGGRDVGGVRGPPLLKRRQLRHAVRSSPVLRLVSTRRYHASCHLAPGRTPTPQTRPDLQQLNPVKSSISLN